MPYAIFVSKRGKPKAAGLPRIWLNGREVGKTEVAVRNDIERCWENDGKMLVDNIEPLSDDICVVILFRVFHMRFLWR